MLTVWRGVRREELRIGIHAEDQICLTVIRCRLVGDAPCTPIGPLFCYLGIEI